MYNFVFESESKRYRSWCSRILTIVRDTLREEDIITQFSLVGSGSRNMIMRNGDGPYDLDYNLEILSMPSDYSSNLHRLKELIRVTLNNACDVTLPFSDAKDSTSVLTSLFHFDDKQSVEFSFDVAIVTRNKNGDLCRLIHNKTARGFGPQGQFVWNEVPDSRGVHDKATFIKDQGKWQQVRDCYRDKKNHYLETHDNNHPSFIVYVEAVNEIYQKLKGGKRK